MPSTSFQSTSIPISTSEGPLKKEGGKCVGHIHAKDECKLGFVSGILRLVEVKRR